MWVEPDYISEISLHSELHYVGHLWSHRYISTTPENSRYETFILNDEDLVKVLGNFSNQEQSICSYDSLNLEIFSKEYIIRNLQKVNKSENDLEHFLYFDPKTQINFVTIDGKSTNLNDFLTQSRKFLGIRSSKLFGSWFTKILIELGLIEELDELPEDYFDDYESILVTLEYIKSSFGSLNLFSGYPNTKPPVTYDHKFTKYRNIKKNLKKYKPAGKRTTVVRMLIDRIEEQGMRL